jgi:hypothetical protein
LNLLTKLLEPQETSQEPISIQLVYLPLIAINNSEPTAKNASPTSLKTEKHAVPANRTRIRKSCWKALHAVLKFRCDRFAIGVT